MRLIRCSQRALLTAIVVIWLPSQTVVVSEYDGSYAGTIECDQIPGHTRGPLKTGFFLRIGGGQVEYERWHVRPAAAGLDARSTASSFASQGFKSGGRSTTAATGSCSLTFLITGSNHASG